MNTQLNEVIEDTVENLISDTKWDNPYKSYAPVIKTSTGYSIHITDQIVEPAIYARVVDTLRNANKNDRIVVYVTSTGGCADTADLIAHSIKRSRATVEGRAAGIVASSGTIIFLACDMFEISPTCVFLFHEGVQTTSNMAKTSDARAYQQFYSEHLKYVFKQAYGDLLTEEEHQSILKGTELWLSGNVVAERLTANSKL